MPAPDPVCAPARCPVPKFTEAWSVEAAPTYTPVVDPASAAGRSEASASAS